ncbi:MAG: hypothetical protein KAR39_13255 [Thermoplasmata archaeon]|nr:hypothetical protein [Thermoplasmata archaeon]
MAVDIGTILKVVCTLVHTDSNIIQNVFHTLVTAGTGPFDDLDVADDLADWVDDMFSEIESSLADTIAPTEVTVYEYDSVDEDWDEVQVGVPTFAPSNVGQEMPRGVAALVNARTVDPDVNGKKYFGTFTESLWAGTFWSTTLVTELIALTGQWYNPHVGTLTGATFESGIWSPKNLSLFPLSGTFIMPLPASYQRRRKPGVGA